MPDNERDQAIEQVEQALFRMWDDGNATGLDGWIGPERGEEPDEYAIQTRDRRVGDELDKLAGLLRSGGDTDVSSIVRKLHEAEIDQLLERLSTAVLELRAEHRRAERAEAEVAKLRAERDQAVAAQGGQS